jgi:hypothetical protein
MMHVTVNENAPLEDEQAWEATAAVAASICATANQTSAHIGITYNRIGDKILIGPRGAPAIPVEYGTYRTPAKRYVKRALDAHRIK